MISCCCLNILQPIHWADTVTVENLLLDQATLDELGFAVHRVDRGGDITYHGPGQLVGYPILNLKRLYGAGIGRIRRYVTHLEEMLIQVLEALRHQRRKI